MMKRAGSRFRLPDPALTTSTLLEARHVMAAHDSTINPNPAKGICAVCGATITGKPSAVAKRTYCSRACTQVAQKGEGNPHWRGGNVERECLQCGVAVQIIPARVAAFKYCSKQCRADADRLRVGELNPKWQGGSAVSQPKYRLKLTEQGRLGPYKPRPAAVRICPKCGLPGVKKGRRFHADCSPTLIHRQTEISCLDCGVKRTVWLGRSKAQERCMACSRKARQGAGNSNWKGGVTPEYKRVRASEAIKVWRKSVFNRDNFICVWCGQRGGKLNADHIKSFRNYPELRFDVSNGRTLCVACHKKTDTYMAAVLKRSPSKSQGVMFFAPPEKRRRSRRT
jgi:hypothetical protein